VVERPLLAALDRGKFATFITEACQIGLQARSIALMPARQSDRISKAQAA